MAMPQEPLRVLLVDDDAGLRETLRLALEAVCGCRVVGEAPSAELAIGLALLEQPDIVVLDHMMPGTSGVAAAPILRIVAPSARIVLYSSVAAHFSLDDVPAIDALVVKGLTLGETVDAILGVDEPIDVRSGDVGTPVRAVISDEIAVVNE